MAIGAKAQFKKGEVVLVSSGEYSDYGIIALCEAVNDFDATELAAIFKAKTPEKKYFDQSDFGDWLIESGHLRKMKFAELYVGSYSEIEPHRCGEVL